MGSASMWIGSNLVNREMNLEWNRKMPGQRTWSAKNKIAASDSINHPTANTDQIESLIACNFFLLLKEEVLISTHFKQTFDCYLFVVEKNLFALVVHMLIHSPRSKITMLTFRYYLFEYIVSYDHIDSSHICISSTKISWPSRIVFLSFSHSHPSDCKRIETKYADELNLRIN